MCCDAEVERERRMVMGRDGVGSKTLVGDLGHGNEREEGENDYSV